MCFLSHVYRSKTNAGTLAQHNASVMGKPGLLLLGKPTGFTVLVLNQISLYIQACAPPAELCSGQCGLIQTSSHP